MIEKSETEIFLEYMPIYLVWHKAILLFAYQIVIFLLILGFYWISGTYFWFGAIVAQLIVSTFLSLYYIYLAKNSSKIREKCRKNGKLAYQQYWLKYQSYINPIVSAAFYFSIFLYKGYDLIPEIIPQPEHFITNELFPIYIALPLGIFIIIFGFIMKKRSSGYDKFVDNYFYEIFPEKSKLLSGGIYRYVRNPQYLNRGLIVIGFGIVANNISAIIVGLIHYISYCAIVPAEDNELKKRFGKDFIEYRKKVPMLFPNFENWGRFIKYLFEGK